MKLLFCCQQYSPSVGGVQEVIRQIATRLAAMGHEVTVATGSHPERAADARIDGVRVLSFQMRGNAVNGIEGEMQAYRDFVLASDHDAIMIKAAQQWSFDALTDILDRIPGRTYFIPCGFSGLRHASYHSYFAQMPQWLAAFDGLVFYSCTYQDYLFAKNHGLANMLTIPNGADEREFAMPADGSQRRRLGIDDSAHLLLSVGSLIACKGHWEVLRAYDTAPLRKPSTLVINANAGARTGMAKFKQMAKNLATKNPPLPCLARWLNLRHLGHKRVLITDLPRSDLVEVFKEADLFVFASKVEYSPLVLFEAAAAGTAFLSADVGNAGEIAEWTGGGKVYPVVRDTKGLATTDPKNLATEMAGLLNQGTQRLQFAAAGRQAFLEKGFSWNDIARQYESVLAGQARPGGFPIPR